RDLLPVYDALAQAVGVLPISPNQRPQGLRPQLMPILREVKGGKRLVITLSKRDNVRFEVGSLPLGEDADDGSDKIAAFRKGLEAGDIDLGSVFLQLPNEELEQLPVVARSMQYRRDNPS